MWRRVVIGLLAWGVGPAAGQSLVDRAKRDETVRVKSDDPEMTAAIAKAKAGLPAFLALAAKPADNQRNFAIKLRVQLGNDAEFIWIRPFERNGDDFVGRVVSQPRNIADLNYGDPLAFKLKHIADWSYLEDGRMKGNATACVLLARETPSERAAFRARYGLDCSD